MILKYNNFFKNYYFLIGLIIFILIISRIDLLNLLNVFKNINYLYLILASVLAMPLLFIKGYRWNYLKKKQKIYYALKDSVLMYGSGLFMGILTPGRIGDLSKVIYLKNNHYSIGKSFVSVILDRVFDLLFLIAFGCLGIFIFFPIFQNFALFLILGLFFFLIIVVILLKNNLIQFFFKKIFVFFIPTKYQKAWKINFYDFIQDLKAYKAKDHLFVFLITVFSWLIYYIQMFLLARSVNINISFLYIAIAVTIANFITLLPISILGIGTRDGILILLFSTFSIANETTISFSALILLMVILMSLIGFYCWTVKPIRLKSIQAIKLNTTL